MNLQPAQFSEMTPADAQLEDEIEREHQAMLNCAKRKRLDQAREHSANVNRLVAQRSPAQVVRMEREKGLR